MKPVETIIKTLDDMVKDSGKSYRQITREANDMGYDVSLWMVLAVANNEKERIKVLKSIDTYMSAVLDVLHCSTEDLIKRMADEPQDRKTAWMSPEMRKFIDNKDARQYIELAYTMYQKDKLEEKQKELVAKLNKK